MTTGILALTIFAAILLQVAIVALFIFFHRKRQYRELGVDREKSQVAIAASSIPATEPVPPDIVWEGFREFIVQRRVLEDSNHTVCSFYLAPIDGKPLPAFKPGQFLTFTLPVKGPGSNKSKTLVRCYSLSDAPRPDCYRVTIKRVAAPPDRPELPPGLSSNFCHDYLQKGCRLMIKAPAGHFHLMEDEMLPVVLIGGGIGITPMLSMLNTLLENGSKREIWLYYGVRNGADAIMKDHLQSLAGRHGNFHLCLCYSTPGEDEAEGVDYQHAGRIDIPLLRATLKLMRCQFYVCGPKVLMESLVPGLEAWGVDSDDIHYESFGPAALIKHEKPETAPEAAVAHPIAITFSRSGKSIPWDPDVDSLLEFAEANGIAVESGCRAGSCGCCQTSLETGEVEYNQQSDVDVEPAHCRLCISTPKSDLTLDL
ncbi:MAG: 2Fe-2S iron-sulfur cluster binding domain-containing protein [Gammaproteobacteria bacterium]|nr:2Fe-2S iron-sulfur cluster binding domain-containing protein [Gammaproteobacteria bacterium]